MDWLLYTIVIILLLKYIVRFLGYLLCYFFIRAKEQKTKEEADRQSILNDKSLDVGISLTVENSIYKWLRSIAYGYIQISLTRIGGIPSHAIRNFIYKNIYHLKLNQNVIIYRGAEIRDPEKVIIGKGTIIGDSAKLDARNKIVIGENVNISTGVWIWTEQHDPQDQQFGLSKRKKTVIIHDRVWISSRVTILPGVEVGEGAVVAAGAVVTKDVEPYSIYGGIPAKKIGERNNNLSYEFNGMFTPFL